MIIPILTTRQREILEFLYVGATRKEIASSLNLSPETVKMHTKNILDKFDATSIRDGFKFISQYITYYGSAGLGYQTFLKNIYHRYEIGPDLTTCKVRRLSEGYVVHGPLKEHVYSIGGTNDILSNVKINNEVPRNLETSGAFINYKMASTPPLRDGEEFTRDLSFDAHSINEQKLHQSSIIIGTPVAKVILEVVFPRGIPDYINGSVIKGVNQSNLKGEKNVTIVENETSYIVEILFPDSEQQYSIDWKFDTNY